MAIRLLSDAFVDRIAAGEVVERPASVVKELLENALDAGATSVSVVVEDAGKSLIRITDNGQGMTKDDLALCIERHATSKLEVEDLLNIHSFGFRGEALPSIGSVSDLSISTHHGDEEHAWNITVEHGRKLPLKPVSLSQGTAIEVRGLFSRTPARLKFLKANSTECAAIGDIVKRMAMAHPHVGFKLCFEQREVLHFPALGSDQDAFKQRVGSIMGREFQANHIPIEAEREGMALHGFLGLSQLHKATTASQYFFINGRSIREKSLYGALRAAYGDRLPHNRHATAVLFFTLDPHMVDVNVHPAKTEVRFRDGALLRSFFVSAIRAGLDGQTLSSPEASALKINPNLGHFSGRPDGSKGSTISAEMYRQLYDRAKDIKGRTDRASVLPYKMDASHQYPFARASGAFPAEGFGEEVQQELKGMPIAADTRANSMVEEEQTQSTASQHGILGAARAQIHDTYIVSQTEDGLVIVDQHAAHERIVYEKLKSGLTSNVMNRQLLLIPEIVELSVDAMSLVLGETENLTKLGLVIEPFGNGAVVVREVPALLGTTNIKKLIEEIAEYLLDEKGTDRTMERLMGVCATMACHGSIRAGRRLNPEEMNHLLREMENTPNAGQCNHGRPTFIQLSLSDIERLFARN